MSGNIIKTWQERMPAPRPWFACDMNCSDSSKRDFSTGCGDCMRIKIYGDPVAARDAEIAELRAALVKVEPMPTSEAQRKTLQFLTDVVTAAGLLSHGKTDKGLAKRICDGAYGMRTAVFTAPVPVSEAANEDAAEGMEILDDLIANIEKDGNYSAEATVTFLRQIRQCFDSDATPAAEASSNCD